MKRRNVEWMACMVLMLFIAAGAGFAVGRGSLIQSRQVQRAIVEDAYYAVPAEVLDSAAASAMMQVLSDPMAGYLNQTQMQAFDDKLTGQQTIGLGMETARVAQGYFVTQVQDASPAALAGLARGDIVTAINGKRVQDGAQWPQWTEGERVVLHVLRGGVEREQVVFAQRIQPFDDVYTEQLTPDVYYMRLRTFAQEDMAQKAIQALCALHPDCAIILDVRGNPGGRLDHAVDIAQQFVPKGETLLTLCKANDATETIVSEGGALIGRNVVVLQDGQSASAAEILAGILQNYGAAHVIGEVSYGKGTVQKVKAISGGCGIRYTVAEYALPRSGRIQGVGVLPDESVPSAAEVPGWALSHAQDTQLQAALTYLQKTK